MTRLFFTLAILLLGSGCASSLISTNALCNGTRQPRAAHAHALLNDGGPKSIATGATLLGQISAACEARGRHLAVPQNS